MWQCSVWVQSSPACPGHDSFSSFPYFDDLDSSAECFVECPSTGICLMFFSRVDRGLWVGGRKITEVKCCSHHIRPRAHAFFLSFFFWPRSTAGGILVPQPGIEPMPLAVEARSPNNWSTREFPKGTCFQHDLPQLMLTLITWLRCVCQVSSTVFTLILPRSPDGVLSGMELPHTTRA